MSGSKVTVVSRRRRLDSVASLGVSSIAVPFRVLWLEFCPQSPKFQLVLLRVQNTETLATAAEKDSSIREALNRNKCCLMQEVRSPKQGSMYYVRFVASLVAVLANLFYVGQSPRFRNLCREHCPNRSPPHRPLANDHTAHLTRADFVGHELPWPSRRAAARRL